jgi:hypothetical protein
MAVALPLFLLPLFVSLSLTHTPAQIEEKHGETERFVEIGPLMKEL